MFNPALIIIIKSATLDAPVYNINIVLNVLHISTCFPPGEFIAFLSILHELNCHSYASSKHTQSPETGLLATALFFSHTQNALLRKMKKINENNNISVPINMSLI